MDDKTALSIPLVYSLHYVAIRRQFGAIGGEVDNRRLNLIKYKYRRPTVMVNRLLIVWFKRDFEDPQRFVLVDNLVVLRRSNCGVQCGIPCRWICVLEVIRH